MFVGATALPDSSAATIMSERPGTAPGSLFTSVIPSNIGALVEFNDAIGGGLSSRSKTEGRNGFVAVVGTGEGDGAAVGRGTEVAVFVGIVAIAGVGDGKTPTISWPAVMISDFKSTGGVKVEFGTVASTSTFCATSGVEVGVGLGATSGDASIVDCTATSTVA